MCLFIERAVKVGISVCIDDSLDSVSAWLGESLLSAKLSNGLLCDALMRLVIRVGTAPRRAALPWLESLGVVPNDKNY
jgi:hypothetical protein